MSKAAGFLEPGGPEVVRLVDVPDPEAGPGQVRVRVKTSGVQPFDVAVVAGAILRQAAGVLTVPGNEFAGVVDQVGEGVDDIAIEGIGVASGETVMVHGAAGAVGAMAVQLCGLRGATVVGVARDAHHDHVRSLGAIPIAYSADFVDRVREIAPQGIDAAIDGVGGEALTHTLQLVKDRSRILTLTDHGKAEQLGIRVTRADRSAARLARLADLYAKGQLTQRAMAVFPLADAAEALCTYQAGNVHGKIVIAIS